MTVLKAQAVLYLFYLDLELFLIVLLEKPRSSTKTSRYCTCVRQSGNTGQTRRRNQMAKLNRFIAGVNHDAPLAPGEECL